MNWLKSRIPQPRDLLAEGLAQMPAGQVLQSLQWHEVSAKPRSKPKRVRYDSAGAYTSTSYSLPVSWDFDRDGE